MTQSTSNHPRRRPPKPLDRARLEEMALAYVARFATSAAKLEAYLARKLRERGWSSEDEDGGGGAEAIARLVARFVELKYVDDEVYARTHSGSLLRRGYGPRRVSQALGAAGIAEEIREAVKAGECEEARAAIAMARKRRFGPFAPDHEDATVDLAKREKQIAAMLRAGHKFDHVRRVLEAASEDDLDEWLNELEAEAE